MGSRAIALQLSTQAPSSSPCAKLYFSALDLIGKLADRIECTSEFRGRPPWGSLGRIANEVAWGSVSPLGLWHSLPELNLLRAPPFFSCNPLRLPALTRGLLAGRRPWSLLKRSTQSTPSRCQPVTPQAISPQHRRAQKCGQLVQGVVLPHVYRLPD